MSASPRLSPEPRRLLWPVLAILLMIAVMVAVVWWRVLRPHEPLTEMATVPSLPAQRGAPIHTDLAGMGEEQLLAAARTAMHAQRLVAPAGGNAVAYYLQVLRKDPRNRVASDALREVFPFAAQAVEQTINAGALDEAQRELDLLARVDPTNYTLTLLNSKLADRRRVAAHDDSPTATPAAAVAATAKPKTVPVPASKPPVAETDVVATTTPTEPHPAAPPANHSPAATLAPAKAAKSAQAAALKRVPPLLLREVPPYYPAPARRQRREGWVEVSYTVGVDGRVDHAHVVRAEPAHLFDHAAVNAVEHWQFQPAQLNGTPVPTVLTSRVNFTLPR